MLGSNRCPEGTKHKRDALLWMVNEGLSRKTAFELSSDKKELPFKDQET